MQFVLSAITHYGYPILFASLFAETVGLPLPAALALLVAGGASAKGPLQPGLVLVTALTAILLGDALMFLLGRYTGWWLLGLLCRLSLNPEACILRSAESFYRRGRLVLVVAKFLPGVNTMAPPLAGSMNMRLLQFWPLDLAGAALYTLAYGGAGFVFSNFLPLVTKQYELIGRIVAGIIALVILIYFGSRVRLWLQARAAAPVSRIAASEVARRLYSNLDRDVAVFDVRSHGYYDKQASRIKGSIRLEPNALHQQIEAIPKDKEIFLYCTCIREATSVRVARLLRERGVQCSVIEGGLRSWKKAGLPLETVPVEEVVLLPTFS